MESDFKMDTPKCNQNKKNGIDRQIPPEVQLQGIFIYL